ncbi:MAG: family 10 glycosylhydrolase [Bacteroidetes bacterium]|jgi:uncharacterized lipoprotein YddW (UPF0748 family)|nr:family 10 glycosylhydrolase [Bacteroidota bacterium]
MDHESKVEIGAAAGSATIVQAQALEARRIWPFAVDLVLLLACVLTLVACQEDSNAPSVPAPTPELRGVWITNVDSKVLDSRTRIDEAMQFLAAHNFNVVFPVVWNDGHTLYPSAVTDSVYGVRIDPRFAGRDPLADVVAAARAHGLAVIPWFEFGFAAAHGTPGPLLTAKPSWAARDTAGDVLTKNNFLWMNGYHPEVQRFLLSLVREVVTRYDIDGVQGDDRLPAQPVEGGYARRTRALYRAAHAGQSPPLAPRDSIWKRWRADQLNTFAARVYRTVKQVDSTLQVSWAPSVYPWSYDEYLQDWPTWMRNGSGDLVHPQVYRRDSTRYRRTLQRQHPDTLKVAPMLKQSMYPGVLLQVGDYRMTPDALLHAVHTNRAQGYAGEVFFFYEGLRADGGRLAAVLRDHVYRDPAPLPFRRASLD